MTQNRMSATWPCPACSHAAGTPHTVSYHSRRKLLVCSACDKAYSPTEYIVHAERVGLFDPPPRRVAGAVAVTA